MGPNLMGLPATSSQHDVVLLHLLVLRDMEGVVGLTTVLLEQPQAYASYAMGPPQVSVFLQQSLQAIAYIFWCLSWGMLYTFRPLEHTCGRDMCMLMMVIGPCQECTEWLLPPLLPMGEPYANQLSSSHLGDLAGSH